MKLKNRRMSNNYEVVKGEKVTPSVNTAEQDKTPVKGWDGRLGGKAGSQASAKRLSELQDTAKPTKLTDGVYPKPYKTVEDNKSYMKRISKIAKEDKFPTEFD